MAFLSGYTKRWEYKVLATKVPSTQTDFPVYVDLSAMPASFWSTVANGGGDIRVTRSDGTTECAREVVSCDTATDTGELHFLANSVDGTTDTVFYIYANGTSADYAVTDTYGRNAVWVDYAGVWHFQTDGSWIDSTGNGNTLSETGTVTTVADVLGNGADMAAGANNLSISDAAQTDLDVGTSDFTYTAWLTIDTLSQNHCIGMKGNAGAGGIWYGYFLDVNNGGRAVVDDGVSAYVASDSFSPSINTPYHLGVVRSGTTLYALRDGVRAATNIHASIGSNLDNSNPFYVGILSTGTFDTDGSIDELRLRKNAVSSDWSPTEYNNQSDHSTFATIGAEETDGGGGGAAFNNYKGFSRL